MHSSRRNDRMGDDLREGLVLDTARPAPAAVAVAGACRVVLQICWQPSLPKVGIIGIMPPRTLNTICNNVFELTLSNRPLPLRDRWVDPGADLCSDCRYFRAGRRPGARAGVQLVGRTLPDSNGVHNVGQPPNALILRRGTSSCESLGIPVARPAQRLPAAPAAGAETRGTTWSSAGHRRDQRDRPPVRHGASRGVAPTRPYVPSWQLARPPASASRVAAGGRV